MSIIKLIEENDTGVFTNYIMVSSGIYGRSIQTAKKYPEILAVSIVISWVVAGVLSEHGYFFFSQLLAALIGWTAHWARFTELKPEVMEE
jgi:hypothetical protein